MITYLTTAFRWFFKLEAASGLLLLIGAVIALILSNSVLSDYYFNILNFHIFIGAKNFGLEVHAGHGLTYESTSLISNIDDISEFNIGHFIVAESLFVGIKASIKKFKKIINR